MSVTAAPRVVIADDSGFMRSILERGLRESGFEVVATARDGDEALDLVARERPDALTLDLAMPGTDGMAVLRALRDAREPVPVVVVSAFSPAHGARAVDALAEGAVDLVVKPGDGASIETFIAELATKVRTASGAHLRRRPSGPAVTVAACTTGAAKLVVIASSTGGPSALTEVIPALPSPLGAGTIVVQHMPAGFTGALAQRLDRVSALDVREAVDGEAPDPAAVLIAPGGRHVRIARRLSLSEEPEVGGLRPRADLTIADAAAIYGERLLLVVLTGMGEDGLAGAREVRKHGGRVIAEHESTATVYGMPRAVVQAGLADVVVPIEQIATEIAKEAGA